MHDITLLQLIEDDIAPTQELLDLLQSETVALHGRDMPLLEQILARKQSLIILLEQQGRDAASCCTTLACSTDRAGVQALAAQSPMARPCCNASMRSARDGRLPEGQRDQWPGHPDAAAATANQSASSWAAILLRCTTAVAPLADGPPGAQPSVIFPVQGTEHTGKMPYLRVSFLPGD
jgi:hypothetical protein